MNVEREVVEFHWTTTHNRNSKMTHVNSDWLSDLYYVIWLPTGLEATWTDLLLAETHSVTQENKAVWLRSDGQVTTSSRSVQVASNPVGNQMT